MPYRCSHLTGNVCPVDSSPPVNTDQVMVQSVQAHLIHTQAKPSSDADVIRGGSVPGKVHQTPGGVARNICECLALLCNSDLLPASGRSELTLLCLSASHVLCIPRVLIKACPTCGIPVWTKVNCEIDAHVCCMHGASEAFPVS